MQKQASLDKLGNFKGAVDGNPLQSFQLTGEGIQALQVVLDVVDHNLLGL